jgi:hypothetical protein
MGKARDLARLSPNSSGQLPTANIADDAINAAKIAANAIATDLGFIPTSSNNFYFHPTNVTPSTPFTGSIPLGVSVFHVDGMASDNVFRTFFTNCNDFNGFIFACIGDQPVRDTAMYQASQPSPAYGVSNFTNLNYTDNGWPSGGFQLGFNVNGSNWELRVRHSSYYSSSNNAGGKITFVRI